MTLSPDTVWDYKDLMYRWCLTHDVNVEPGFRLYIRNPDGSVEKVKGNGAQSRTTLGRLQMKAGLKVTRIFDEPTRHFLDLTRVIDLNVAPLDWLGKFLGPKEQYGPNDGPWLRAEQHKVDEDWMHIQHQPYCAEIGLEVATFEACHFEPRTRFGGLNTAYCPSIYDAIIAGLKSTDGKIKFVHVNPDVIHKGDIIILTWGGAGSNPHGDHLARARADSLTAMSPVLTREANTGPGDAGNQSDGDGVYDRVRSRGNIAVVGRLQYV